MGGNRKKNLKKNVPATSTTLIEGSEPSNNDDELMDDLFAELEQRDKGQTIQAGPPLSHELAGEIIERGPKKDSRTRHKEREMRKMAAQLARQGPQDEAAATRIQQETEEEEKAILAICQADGLEIKEITPDGHCLFAAIADQLALLSIIPLEMATYKTTRAAAARYILEHPDDFLPFLVALHTEDDPNANTYGSPMSIADLQKYCAAIGDTGIWGGEPEILALAKAYNVPIHVIQCGKPSVVIHPPRNPDTSSSNQIVRISYHRRMYGLGEHYNSVRPKLL